MAGDDVLASFRLRRFSGAIRLCAALATRARRRRVWKPSERRL